MHVNSGGNEAEKETKLHDDTNRRERASIKCIS